MDSLSKFNETVLPNKESFYSNLNLENIFNSDHEHSKKVWNIFFHMKNIGDYHDLYILCDTLPFPDLFNNFRSTCLKIYKLDPANLNK